MERHRILAAVALVVSSVLAQGQKLAVRVHPEKPTSPLGEAVFVVVELTNDSSSIVEFADDGECAQSFKPLFSFKRRTRDNLYGCAGGGTAGSCAGSVVELKPSEKLSHRYLLPDGLEPEDAGDFDYTLQTQIRFYASDGSHEVIDQQEVGETFTIHAVKASQSRIEADYVALVADLQSRDARQHWLAVSAITEHPQPFLEPVILKLSHEPQTMSISVAGLQKLGTDRAKQRMAELTGSKYEESLRQRATTGLAELGDTAYCQLMLQLMNLRQGYTSEIAARGAGLLCGEKAIPGLASLLREPTNFPSYEIAYALGNTGSRIAVPILIELLGNADARGAASGALYTLAHRQSNSDDSAAERQDWVSWWALHGKTAQIFDPTECP